MSKKEEAEQAAKMPLTAHMEIAPLEKSTTGWKPMSISAPQISAPDPSGNLAPDVVQRKVKAALNKMTPEKFDRISDQILEIASQSKNETDGRTLRQVIQLTFEKATDEAHWAGMYAKFCQKMLTSMSTDIRDETIKDKNGNPVVGGALFRKYLLNRCQEEFERGWQANLPEKPEGDSKEAALLSDEYYVAAAAKRRGLGLIQFIGQLYKLKMLTLRIMHECVMRLLNFEGDPDEAAVENLTTLLRAVGGTMEEDEQGGAMLNMYFQRIDAALLKNNALASRPRFMIMDLLDLRKAGWRGKDDAKGPKTIEQIHQEAAAAQAKAEAERARTSQRGGGRPPAGRGDARQFSGGAMQAPVDYARTSVAMDDLRRLQNRNASQRTTGAGLGPGGGLGPSALSGRGGSRRGNLGPSSSGNTTRTNTPPVDKEKKDEPTQQNAFR
jgi:translation initiation factor 4G